MTHSAAVPLAQAGRAHGGKAANLAWLMQRGYRVPDGIVTGSPDAPALLDWIEPDKSYAVRPSASVEDMPGSSFSGQFVAVLGVVGAEAVQRAVARVLDSTRAERLKPSLQRAGVRAGDIQMHVVVQEMVGSVMSGVVSSRNPLTGLSDIVIEAVHGTGEGLVSGKATPERWVQHWGEWTQRPDDSVVPAAVAAELSTLVAAVADEWGGPIDLEWSWDGERLYLLQVRPMTGTDVPVYSNRLAKEYLPGIIPPLVWSVNVPLVNGAWIELFTSMVGPLGLEPEDLSRQLAYRAYFNMKAIGDIFEAMSMPRDLLEVLMGVEGGAERPKFRPGTGVVRHLSRMTRMGWRLVRYDRELDELIPRVEHTLGRIEARDLGVMSDQELLHHVVDIECVVREVAFANIVTTLLLNGYGALFRRRLEKRGVDPHQIDLGTDGAALEAYDPSPHLARLSESLAGLDDVTRARIRDGELSLVPGGDGFLERFGHVSDSGNDFSKVTWREDPSQLGALLEPPAAAGSSRGKAPTTATDLGRVDGVLARRTSRYRLERERVSYTYARSYGQLRPAVLEAARRLVERGSLEDIEDVFMLERPELEEALLAPATLDLSAKARRRREEMARLRDVDMPETIFGDDFDPAPPGDPARTLTGIPSSRGIRRATARVVSGVKEATAIEIGDIVVIPHSDVAWMPLLARAGGIVSEAGGLLSHSSIVARELGIPCVVSVSGAMRIPDGSTVRVDGYTGAVQWEEAA